jgi:hypothetical protein
LDVEHEEMVVLTIFIVKEGSRLFLTHLPSRCRAAELWCCGEVSSSARGDDDRHARREEQRASGLAKVVKSNLGIVGQLREEAAAHGVDVWTWLDRETNKSDK